MIGKACLFIDACSADSRPDIGRHQMVVETPAAVVFEGLLKVRPPGELSGVEVGRAKCINPAQFVLNAIHPGTLPWEKTGDMRAANRIVNVNLAMRNIVIGAHDIRAAVLAHSLQLPAHLDEKIPFYRPAALC